MTVILPLAHISNTTPDDEYAEVIIHVHARIIAPDKVRRKVNGWLCLEVGDRLLAGNPELIAGTELVWRVPVQWTSPTQGVLAETIGHIRVDAATGEMIADASTVQEVQQRVAALANSPRFSGP